MLGRFARIRFGNASYRLHPMHTHGMVFVEHAEAGMRPTLDVEP